MYFLLCMEKSNGSKANELICNTCTKFISYCRGFFVNITTYVICTINIDNIIEFMSKNRKIIIELILRKNQEILCENIKIFCLIIRKICMEDYITIKSNFMMIIPHIHMNIKISLYPNKKKKKRNLDNDIREHVIKINAVFISDKKYI